MLAYGFEIVHTLIVDIELDTLMGAKAQKKLEIMRAEKNANEKAQALKKLELEMMHDATVKPLEIIRNKIDVLGIR
jgi:hypothetical protein